MKERPDLPAKQISEFEERLTNKWKTMKKLYRNHNIPLGKEMHLGVPELGGEEQSQFI